MFVTGGTGFIGSHFLKILREAGREAKCLVRASSKGGICTSRGFATAKGDITERDAIKGDLDGMDTVVHLAGIIEERGKQTFNKCLVTSDQLALLSRDNTCDPEAVRKEFGFEPVTYRRAIELSTLQREPGR